jgi:hypothetical protein
MCVLDHPINIHLSIAQIRLLIVLQSGHNPINKKSDQRTNVGDD